MSKKHKGTGSQLIHESSLPSSEGKKAFDTIKGAIQGLVENVSDRIDNKEQPGRSDTFKRVKNCVDKLKHEWLV